MLIRILFYFLNVFLFFASRDEIYIDSSDVYTINEIKEL